MKNATNSDITVAIEELIADRAIFSAYDVTKYVRGENLHVYHKDVKSVVYNFTFPFFYDREVVTVNGSGVLVNCPDSKNYTDYKSDDIPEIPVGLPTTVTTPAVVTNSTMFDRQGRYSVPAKVVRDAGFVVADKVICNFLPDKIVLTKTGTGDKEYKVDTYGNIRIYQSDMKKSFVTLPSAFDVTANDVANMIVLQAS